MLRDTPQHCCGSVDLFALRTLDLRGLPFVLLASLCVLSFDLLVLADLFVFVVRPIYVIYSNIKATHFKGACCPRAALKKGFVCGHDED